MICALSCRSAASGHDTKRSDWLEDRDEAHSGFTMQLVKANIPKTHQHEQCSQGRARSSLVQRTHTHTHPHTHAHAHTHTGTHAHAHTRTHAHTHHSLTSDCFCVVSACFGTWTNFNPLILTWNPFCVGFSRRFVHRIWVFSFSGSEWFVWAFWGSMF